MSLNSLKIVKKSPITEYTIMGREFDNFLVDYWDPIDLMDHSLGMEIDLCWYQKGTNNKWTYDLMDHLMVDLETIIAIA